MNKKLKTIYSMLEANWFSIADIGCDHAFLSVRNAELNHGRKFYNVDNKEMPLATAIKNHEHVSKINAEFILANGISYFKENKIPIDCCIIAGIGGFNCIDILKQDSIYIKNYIIQVDNNQEFIDNWVIGKKYKIKQIEFVNENNIDYLIYKIEK